MHTNSLTAHIGNKQNGSYDRRRSEIIKALSEIGKGTARDIKRHLNYDDMNQVRPRICELVKDGVVIEAGNVIDDATGRPVSVFTLASNRETRLEEAEPAENLFDMTGTLNPTIRFGF